MLALSGCMDSAQSQMDEEKESNFLMGKSRIGAMDYPAAIESFEKALEVNPKSGAAHFELACLYDTRRLDPADAIYHYQEFLKLRPKTEYRGIVNQHILALKQELVSTISLGPVSERQQREIERLILDNQRLTDEVEKWRTYAAHLQTLTNQQSVGTAINRPAERPLAAPASGANTVSSNSTALARDWVPAPSNPRTHSVQAGETPSVIARKYHVKLEALMAANPRLDPRRMRVGQTLILPSASL